MRQIEDQDFQSEVREAELPTVVMFTGNTCNPCKAMKPDMEFLAQAFEGDVQFVEMPIEVSTRTASDLGVRAVPTLVLINEGMVRDTMTGRHNKLDIRQWINEAI